MKLTSFNNLLAAAFVVSAAAGVAVSCQQTPTGPETPDPLDDTTTEVIIPVSLERPISPDADSTTPDTRVTVDPTTGVTAWEINDEVAVWIQPKSTPASGSYVTAKVKNSAISVNIAANKERAYYAVYPADQWDGNYTSWQVKYPKTYDMSGKDLSAANKWAPTPMMAINTEGDDLRFFHVGGLLRLHITDVPSGATGLTVEFKGLSSPNYVSGSFVVNNRGTITANTTYSSNSENKITFNNVTPVNNEVYINLPVPTIDFSGLTSIEVKSTGASTNYTTERLISGWGPITHAKGKKATVNFVSVSFLDGFDGSFNGGLDISPGILKYDGNTNTGSHGFTLTSGENPLELLDHFKKSASINVYYHFWTTTSGTDTKGLKYRLDGAHTHADITGTIMVGMDEWRIPSISEWATLISKTSYTSKINNSNANARYFTCNVSLAEASDVCGNDYRNKGLLAADKTVQSGLVILPEHVSVFCPGITKINNAATFADNNITWPALKKLIDAGCAFLPTAGCYTGSSWANDGITGLYWSSSVSGTTDVSRLMFNASDAGNTSGATNQSYYFPVRLIKEHTID